MYSTTRRLCAFAVATILALGCMPDGDGEEGDDPIALAGGSMGAGGDTGGDIIPVGGAEPRQPHCLVKDLLARCLGH